MKTKTASKRSSKPRSKSKSIAERYNLVIPEKQVWDNWKTGVKHDVEFDGVKFQASVSAYGLDVGSGTNYATSLRCGGAGSCSYVRIYPAGRGNVAAKWGWWLHNVKINHGTIAYLIPTDGDIDRLLMYMKQRGFIVASVTKSIHAPGYPVYLLVHTGDKILKQTRTKKVDLDADVLGASASNSDGVKLVRDPARSDKSVGLI